MDGMGLQDLMGTTNPFGFSILISMNQNGQYVSLHKDGHREMPEVRSNSTQNKADIDLMLGSMIQ